MSIPSAIYGPTLGAIASCAVRITEHATEAMRDDAVTLDDVLHAASSGEVIEDYPGGFPLPSCRVLGGTPDGGIIHSVWAFNGTTRTAILVTCYRPDPGRWIDHRVRKP